MHTHFILLGISCRRRRGCFFYCAAHTFTGLSHNKFHYFGGLRAQKKDEKNNKENNNNGEDDNRARKSLAAARASLPLVVMVVALSPRGETMRRTTKIQR